MMKKIIQTSDDLAIAIIRMVLGVVIFAHGLQKLIGSFGGHGFSETIDLWYQWWEMPAILTIMVIFIESFGALALIFGFLGRLMSLGIGLVMCGAIYMVHFRWGFFMNWYAIPQTGEGFEYHLLVLAMVLSIIIRGSGGYSVDRFIIRKLSERKLEINSLAL